MFCANCGGLVTWRGPLSQLTHTECEKCGGQNCQVPESEEIEDDDDEIEHDCGEDTCCCAGRFR